MLRSPFDIKSRAFRPATLLKKDSDTGAFCEICEIFNNTYFEEHLRTTGLLKAWITLEKNNFMFLHLIFQDIFT